MAQLAIKGHQTRGKEVIEILEMLGGNNPDKLISNFDYLGYFIGKETRNIYHFHLQGFDSKNVIIFTLEEFLEKFPYKIGDKVSSKYLKNYEVSKMEWESVNNRVIYKLQGMGWYSADELQPYKKETMDKVNKAVFDANAQCCDIMNHLIKQETMEEKLCIGLFPVSNGRKEIIPCDGYEVVSDEGKFYVVKKPPKDPKTHVECCEILYPNENFQTVAQPIKGHNGQKLFALQKLLVCRDAYWKIAGEQMGLGRQWEPVWDGSKFYYCIFCDNNEILEDEISYGNAILTFPTAEMREAFHENFKELIEECKELL